MNNILYLIGRVEEIRYRDGVKTKMVLKVMQAKNKIDFFEIDIPYIPEMSQLELGSLIAIKGSLTTKEHGEIAIKPQKITSLQATNEQTDDFEYNEEI